MTAVKKLRGSRPFPLVPISEVEPGTSEDTPLWFRDGALEEKPIMLPVDPLLEIQLKLDETWDGRFRVPRGARGARVKLVVHVPESRADELDRKALQEAVLAAGALSCRPPEVHVSRKKTKRDDRHNVELPLRESLEIFAAETQTRAPVPKVEFAERLAVEADEGVKE